MWAAPLTIEAAVAVVEVKKTCSFCPEGFKPTRLEMPFFGGMRFRASPNQLRPKWGHAEACPSEKERSAAA
jgi:hypothetical protein